MRQRIQAFGLLLGGVPSLDDDLSDSGESFAGKVLSCACKNLEKSIEGSAFSNGAI